MSDIVHAMKLSNTEGWNQTEKDWKLLIESPQNVCMLAECNRKIIGTTTAMNYSNQIAWIGMVLVDKEYRHKAWLLKRNNSITGFALGRKGNKYHQVGPVFASNINDVKMLIRKALEELINQPVVMDVLSEKEDLINWLNSIGFIMQRQFVRMYKKENPFPGIINNQYLICGPEFG